MSSETQRHLYSIVIPARNVEDYIGLQLEALQAQTFDGNWEVIVADNGSTDRTRERILEWAERLPCLRVVDASARIGISAARNTAAAEARGDYLLFLDADDQASPGWLAAMAAASETSDLLGGAEVKFDLDADGEKRFEGEEPSRSALVKGYDFLPFARGCNFGVRTEVFRRFGGCNEGYKQGEDVELCWRLQLGGHEFRYVPDAVVYYRVPRDPQRRRRTAFRDGQGVPQLYRDFRKAGMPRSSTTFAFRDVVGVVLFRPRRWFDPDRRAELIARLSWRAGNIVGSLRNHVFYL